MEIEMRAVESSLVAEVGYDEETHTLRVYFNDGAKFDYPGVPKAIGEGMALDPSPGRFWHREIKGKYESRRL